MLKNFVLPMVFANTLTDLLPDLYQGLDIVSRELVGMIPSVTLNASAAQASKDQYVEYPIFPTMASSNITPSMTLSTPSDLTITTGQMQITKLKKVDFYLTGEDTRGLNNSMGAATIKAGLFAQAFRTLCNEVEADLVATGKAAASRAYGTAGTTPFASDLSASAQIKKILDDNGAPLTGRILVVDTTAGANLRTLAQLTKANEAGSAMTLRDGTLLDLHGHAIKESAAITSYTAGTGASATTNNAGYAIGATTITLASAGTGTILAGDVVTFAGDSNKYVVVTGDADVSNGGTIVIAAPGLRKAIAASTTAITVVGTSTRNLYFAQSAIHLVARVPSEPEGGDAAVFTELVTDARSGLTFAFKMYKGEAMNKYQIGLAWGTGAFKTEHIATLLG